MTSRRALRVLVVDDEIWFRDELRERRLKLRPDHQVEVAANGSEALYRLETADRPFDVVVIDYVLGKEENGIGVMRRLRQVSPASPSCSRRGLPATALCRQAKLRELTTKWSACRILLAAFSSISFSELNDNPSSTPPGCLL